MISISRLYAPGVTLRLKWNDLFMLVLLCFAAFLCSVARINAQALPTAYSNVSLSAFGGLTGNYSGVELAKNGDITAGFDVGVRPFAGFYPMLEVRGLYPVNKGNVVAQKNFVGGLRLGRRRDRFAGYGDILFGRGRLTFANGFPAANSNLIVLSNTSNVLSLGGGADWDWTQHFGLKADVQLQSYDSPVTASGKVYSKLFTLGVIYRFGSGSVR